MTNELNFDEKFRELGNYYNINSPVEIRQQLKKNENIFILLDKIKPILEKSFKDANYALEMNYEPEMDDKFIILRVNVSEERFNNGVGDEIRDIEFKIWDFECLILEDLGMLPIIWHRWKVKNMTGLLLVDIIILFLGVLGCILF